MLRRLAPFAAVALPLVAVAEPAVVRVFEASARAEPAKDAAVLQTFAEGAPVSVSEEATNGWRKIRLPDGRVGWVEESALSFPAARAAAVTPSNAPATAAAAAQPSSPAPAAAMPPSPSTPAPALLPLPAAQARIYVKDLDHLAELVKADPEAGPIATKLTERRNAAYVVGGIGLAVSTGFVVYGVSQWGKHLDPSDPSFGKTAGSDRAFYGGMIGALASGLVAAAIHPWRSDFLDLVNTWNTRHPDRPFTLEHGHVER